MGAAGVVGCDCRRDHPVLPRTDDSNGILLLHSWDRMGCGCCWSVGRHQLEGLTVFLEGVFSQLMMLFSIIVYEPEAEEVKAHPGNSILG